MSTKRNVTSAFVVLSAALLLASGNAPEIVAPSAEVRAVKSSDSIQWVRESEWKKVAQDRKDNPIAWFCVTRKDNCPQCRVLETRTFRDPRVVQASRQFVCVKLEEPSDATRWKVRGFPSSIFVPRSGNILSVQGQTRLTTPTDPKSLVEQFNQAIKAASAK